MHPTNTLFPPATLEPIPTKSANIDFIDKLEDSHIRVISYNINWDAIFPVGDPDSHDLRKYSKAHAFVRVMRALNPDIVCLQEINPERDPSEISEILNDAFGLSEEEGWQASIMRDNVIVSRYEVLEDGWQIDTNTFRPNMEQAAALINLPEALYDVDIYVICSHFKASGSTADIRQRQQQADVVISNIRDIRTLGGNMDVPFGTPFILLGDFNVYTSDPAAHLSTMITGDVDDDDRYGPDFQPDWDESELTDLLPKHNGLGIDSYTWRDNQAVFETGVLDHILYPDSVMKVENAFILNTAILSDEALAMLGLQEFDVLLNPATGYYDHLPLVVDFSIVDMGKD